MPHIVITPINIDRPSTDLGKKARTDYLREQENSAYFKIPIAKWDDSKFNSARVGDYFGFVQQTKDIVEVFQIERIVLGRDRPDYWDIEEHRRRDILILSRKIIDIKWSSYKEENGYKENFVLRGTTKMKFYENKPLPW
jgi:hypothetical protein